MEDEVSTSKNQKDVAVVTFNEASASKQETKDLEMGIVSESHGHGDSTNDDEDEWDEEDEWMKHIEAELNKNIISRPAGTGISRIPRVPLEIYQNANESYKPCIISIGPYHWRSDETKHMEQCKWQCLKDILDRKTKGHLKEFFKVLKPLEEPVKAYYRGGVNLKSWDFMQMMLLDGCFIVDYLLHQPSKYIPNTNSWMKRQIVNDLLLLVNQLPFSVLVKTFPLVKEENVRERLEDFTLKFCRCVSKTCPARIPPELRETEFEHLLDFYHACLFFFTDRRSSSQSTESNQIPIITIRGASILKNVAGIKFKSMNVTDKVMDASFTPGDGVTRDGVMNITPLVIDAFTRSQFQNLIAFEAENHDRIEPRFTAFARFMDYIIDTDMDVSVLREEGIIEHTLGTDAAVAAIFNQSAGIFDHIPPDLAETYKRADEYYKKQRNKCMAILKQKYMDSPWAVISIIVAALIFLFTFTQTFVAILAYMRPPKS